MFRGSKSLLGRLLLCSLLILSPAPLFGQVIEFWSNGLKYQALTRSGLTLMFAHLPLIVRNFAVVQVAFNNGSNQEWVVQPTDFTYVTEDGRVIAAVSEYNVITEMYRRAGRNEVMKLQTAYEKALYGNQHIRSNSGYEARRQNAMAGGPAGIKAAAAASAISFVRTKLKPGDATDGAIFFPSRGKGLGPGKLTAQVHDETFEVHSVPPADLYQSN